MNTTVRKPAGTTNPDLEDTIALLARTPATLGALLRDLPESWTLRNEGEGTWNVLEVIAHLNHCERTDWLTRAKMILRFGESRTFDALDRAGHAHELQGKTLAQLLDEFARLRSANLDELQTWNLQPGQLELRGRHPAFGVVTLSELLATWAVHDLTHLHQISRMMAQQYRETVGPWSAYLGVLHCNGHSSS
jgi:DinB superfamily